MPSKERSAKKTKDDELSDREELQPQRPSQDDKVSEDDPSKEVDGTHTDFKASPKAGQKCKDPPTSSTSTSKAARRSFEGTKTKPATIHQTPHYLLTPAAIEQCRPNEESKAFPELNNIYGSRLQTYSSSVLTPFAEFVCAAVLSRPVPHALGHRSIHTILNEPYSFTKPKSIRAIVCTRGGFVGVIRY